ncbi:MAG: hypothetical protein KH100_06965 [Dysgonomonas mossii]|uniref:hypothetical protein n=1 Tax=Dysgonomonas mossii TaxID=163665 RepID=UPI001D98A48F|nr:hypothetical protein [Dysgonomonas mossii]MBS5796154.1 hypothetical protein [Dysgonomonas mossii]MBS7110926.1 hypothetical protein [Dysgonomonas mossii]
MDIGSMDILLKQVYNIIQKRGYQTKVFSDYSFALAYENSAFVIRKGALEFDCQLEITLPKVYSVNKNNISDALKVANEINKNISIFKAIVEEGDVYFIASIIKNDDSKLFEFVIMEVLDFMTGNEGLFKDRMNEKKVINDQLLKNLSF